MEEQVNYFDLVRQAQLGSREDMDRLAKLAQGKIYAYIYRLTLDEELARDLLQETMLTMVGSLKKLKYAEKFWPWLFRTAMGKVQHHFRDRPKGTVQMSILSDNQLSHLTSSSGDDGLNSLKRRELSKTIFSAMRKLRLRHRNVLALRCFEQLPYSEIAAMMDCSELQSRVLFFRAKRSLKHQLARDGFGKGLLLTALTLFGQMTTHAEASVSQQVTVAGSTTSVGPAAALVGMAGTIAIATAAALLAVMGIIAVIPESTHVNINYNSSVSTPAKEQINSIHFKIHSRHKDATDRLISKGVYDEKYFFPEGLTGAMMMRVQLHDPRQRVTIRQWLQNGQANYDYYVGANELHIHNCRLCLGTFRVRRLPTDPPAFIEFLSQLPGEDVGFHSQADGKLQNINYVCESKTGFLVEATDSRFPEVGKFTTSFQYNTLDENILQADWPNNMKIIDKRDAMHKRGWTYFRVEGEIAGEKVHGLGRIPFFYDAFREYPPWLRLKIANRFEIIDIPSGAYLTDPDGKVIATYQAGSFFQGLAQPWMGMHNLDIVRRDAVKKRIWFETKLLRQLPDYPYYKKAEVTFVKNQDNTNIRLVYLIDIRKDVLESIKFITQSDGEKKSGKLIFLYLDKIEQADKDFVEPVENKNRQIAPQQSLGIVWLIRLAEGNLDSYESFSAQDGHNSQLTSSCLLSARPDYGYSTSISSL